MTTLPLFTPSAVATAVDETLASAKETDLLDRLRAAGRTIVAFSGGVDSTYLAWAAARALGEQALAITGVSESLPQASRLEAPAIARSLGIAHEMIETAETADPRYLANDRDRCYWCKTELYARLVALAGERGYRSVADGTNRDDLGDVRPGRRAAGERGVRSPLAEAGLGKAEVRFLSRRAGLPTWDQPASPCLSSRVPYGMSIDASKLRSVDRAEAAVRALGFRELRVRHLGAHARIEVAAEELTRALEPSMRARIAAAVRAEGFAEAVVDAEPFRSGRLNRERVETGGGGGWP